MKLSQLKKKYRNQWILAEVVKEDQHTHEPIEVKIIAHSPNREDTYKAMEKMKGKHFTHFYNGPVPKKGYAFAF